MKVSVASPPGQLQDQKGPAIGIAQREQLDFKITFITFVLHVWVCVTHKLLGVPLHFTVLLKTVLYIS